MSTSQVPYLYSGNINLNVVNKQGQLDVIKNPLCWITQGSILAGRTYRIELIIPKIIVADCYILGITPESYSDLSMDIFNGSSLCPDNYYVEHISDNDMINQYIIHFSFNLDNNYPNNTVISENTNFITRFYGIIAKLELPPCPIDSKCFDICTIIRFKRFDEGPNPLPQVP